MADVTVTAAAVRSVAGNPDDVFDANAASGFTPTKGKLVAISGNDEVDQCDARVANGLVEPVGIVEAFKAYPTSAGGTGYRVTARFGGILEGFSSLTAGDVLYNSTTPGAIADADPTDALLDIGTLTISATAEKFKTTTVARFKINGTEYTKAATDNLTFGTAYTINDGPGTGDFWGAFLIQINASGTVTAKAVSADQAYATEAAAIAALPAADDDKAALGYITVQANTDSTWTADTDDMTGASDCQSASFVDGQAGEKDGKKIGVALNATQVLLAMPSL